MKPMKISAPQATQYYYQADPLYSVNGEPGSNAVWVGSGADVMGLKGQQVDMEVFNNLLHGMDPQGEIRLVGKANGEQAHHKYAAVDTPLTTPKSFSVQALYDSELREAIQRAAVSTAEEAERHIYGRQTINGVTELVPGQMIGVLFHHSLSRTQDIHDHLHLVSLNAVIRPDGTFSTLENRELFRHQREITQDFYSRLAMEAKAIGYGIELRSGNAGQIIPELAGFNQEVNDLFSKRHHTIKNSDQLRNDIQQRMPHLSPEAVESLIQLQSKEAKTPSLTETDVVNSHTAQMAAIGIDAHDYVQQLKNAGLQRQNEVTERHSAGEYIALVLQDTTTQESVFSRERIINDAVKLSVGECVRSELETAYTAALKNGEIIAYTNHDHTTPGIEQIETRIVTAAVREAQAFSPLMTPEQAAEIVAHYEAVKGFSTSPGQAAAIKMALTTTGRLSIIAGDAGSGKSTAFEAVNIAIENLKDRKEVNIFGLGFQGQTAAQLEATSGIKSLTVDSFLLQPSEQSTGERQLWVVDESSMLGSRHLNALLDRAGEANAQIVLVGDAKQLASISAGKMLSELQRLGLCDTSIMDEVMRQKTGYTREITQALKQHDVETAFAVLSSEGKLTELEDRQDRINAAADLYVSTIADGGSPLAMTVTNKDRQELIAAIRDRQMEAGQIGRESIAVITREPVNLQGVDKRLAVRYDPDAYVIAQSPIGELKQGTEARILASDTRNNSIIVATPDGHAEEILLREHGAKLSMYRERETYFTFGEKGIFLKNDNSVAGRYLGIKNGVTFEITDIQNDGMATLKLENGHTVTRDLNGANVTNGQVVTIDKSQGVSVHTGILMMSSDAPPALLNENKNYVGMSRMTNDLFLITDNRELLLESVKGEQVKSSTTEHTLTDNRLAELKAAIVGIKGDLQLTIENHTEDKAVTHEPDLPREDSKEIILSL